VLQDDVLLIDFDNPRRSKLMDICAFYNHFIDFEHILAKQREY